MTDPNEEYRKYEEGLDKARNMAREAIKETLQKNANDWAASSAWSAFSLDNTMEGSESPEAETPSVEELVLLEIGKLQWVNMQILNELRQLNGNKKQQSTS